MSKVALRILALCWCLAAPFAGATVVKDESIEVMATHVQVIVRGAVKSVQPMVDVSGRIWTYVEVAVTETLKGDAGALLLVKQPGGVIGDRGQWVSGTAKFAVGQDCVLFLERARDEAAVHVVYALAAGKVDLEVTRGAAVAVRHLDGLGFASKGAERPLRRPVGGDEVLGTPAAFLDRVRKAVKGAAR